uniref:Uncharacterized protein n=1 Tax=Roseihalotalea indica TaxID=2867963 RepID=A0AA49JEW2_9BACT|nr:hypothetical protein K4G66_03620 [Tunicatimonas sp. TK19036]
MAVYETMTLGITYSYWLFTISVGLLLWYSYRRRKADEEKEKAPPSKPDKKKKSPKR